MLGFHTIHIKSDVILQKSDSKDGKKRRVDDEHRVNDESELNEEDEKDEEDDESEKDEEVEEGEEDDKRVEEGVKLAEENEEIEESEEEEEEEEDEEGLEMRARLPTELLEIRNDDRGPLYHSLCNEDLLYPKDARRYRIRRLQATGNRVSRVQTGIIVDDFGLPGPNLEYETRGSLAAEEEGERKEDEPAAQISLAFLRVNKQVCQEASTRLYSTRTFGFDDPTTFAQFLSFQYIHVAQPPTPINGKVLLKTKRNTIRSIHIRAKTALFLRQKILWMSALDAAHFVLPELQRIRVLFDLSYEGDEGYMDGTLWQYSRHRNDIRLLKSAEIRVATHLSIFMKDERSYEIHEVGWRVQLVEAIIEHHLDVLFGGSLLNAVSVEARDAIFAQG